MLPLFRQVYAVAPLLYLAFVLWDLHIDASQIGETLPLRACAATFFVTLFFLAYVPFFTARLSWLLYAGDVCASLGVSVVLLRLRGGFDYGMAGLTFGVIGNLVLAPSLRTAAIGYALLLIIPNLIMWLGNVPPFSVINTNLFLIPWVTLSTLLSYFLDRKNRNAFWFEAQFERLASLDLLSGVNNRHALMNLAAKELSRARRYHHPLSLLILDIDDFKRINDTRGHSVGDQAIKQLASICSGTLRAADIFGRLGGDEFAAVLPETDRAEAFKLAERLRLTLAADGVRMDDGTLRFTISIGGASLSDPTEDIDAVMRRADTALYEAKRRGRNRVVMAKQPDRAE